MAKSPAQAKWLSQKRSPLLEQFVAAGQHDSAAEVVPKAAYHVRADARIVDPNAAPIGDRHRYDPLEPLQLAAPNTQKAKREDSEHVRKDEERTRHVERERGAPSYHTSEGSAQQRVAKKAMTKFAGETPCKRVQSGDDLRAEA